MLLVDFGVLHGDDFESFCAAGCFHGHLVTNNPAKEEALRGLGIDVVRRIPVLVPTNPFSASYLETKRSRMRHHIPATTPHHAETHPTLALAVNGRK